jgi:hypothetical protein
MTSLFVSSTRKINEVNWFQSHQEQLTSVPAPLKQDPSIITPPPPGQPFRGLESDEANEDVDMDSMQSSIYFASPVQTLVDSVQDATSEHISLHDIADAYSTLSMRVQVHANAISRVDRALTALDLIKSQASVVVTALRRDIRRAFVDPVPGPHQSVVSFASDDWIVPRQAVLGDIELKLARDQSFVCHHSLQFLSDIFRFPALQESFSGARQIV